MIMTTNSPTMFATDARTSNQINQIGDPNRCSNSELISKRLNSISSSLMSYKPECDQRYNQETNSMKI